MKNHPVFVAQHATGTCCRKCLSKWHRINYGTELNADERNYVIVGSQQETSVANVFAIGDVANPLAPTIAGAVGAGATAAKVIASRLVKQ